MTLWTLQCHSSGKKVAQVVTTSRDWQSQCSYAIRQRVIYTPLSFLKTRRRCKAVTAMVLGILFVIQWVTADLPIHSAIRQVANREGEHWHFVLSNPKYDFSHCGSDMPNKNTGNLSPDLHNYVQWMQLHAGGVQDTYDVVLSDNLLERTEAPEHQRTITALPLHRRQWRSLAALDPLNTAHTVGLWTMVYDEGFEVKLDDITTLFAFLKYTPANAPDKCRFHAPQPDDEELPDGTTQCYVTDPSRTSLGWYSRKSENDKPYVYGCFYGEKVNSTLKAGAVRHTEDHMYVVTNTPVVRDTLMVQKENGPLSSLGAWDGTEPFSRAKFPTVFTGHEAPFDPLQSDALRSIFFSKPSKKLVFSKDVSGERYACGDQSPDETLLHKESGTRPSHNVLAPIDEDNRFRLPINYSSISNPFSSPQFETIKVVTQGQCGSCYAIASAFVLEERAKLGLMQRASKSSVAKLQGTLSSNGKQFVYESLQDIKPSAVFSIKPMVTTGQTRDFQSIDVPDISVSFQTILSCSFFNQGCNGGYPMLVGRWAKYAGIPLASCMRYTETDATECPMNLGPSYKARADHKASILACSSNHSVFAADYGYVGGCYECCSEKAMQEEIFARGPIVAALDVPDSLFDYKDGVLTQNTGQKHHRVCDDPGKRLNGWEFTNHAVAIVGWGEERDVDSPGSILKYWIVRNSWGPRWGRQGYFKIKRGVNFRGIEAQAVFIDPDFTRGYLASVTFPSKNESYGGFLTKTNTPSAAIPWRSQKQVIYRHDPISFLQKRRA